MTVIQFKKKSNKINTNKFVNSFIEPPTGVSAIGIDLGTTNSVVSIYKRDNKHPQTLVYENSELVPSMIYIDNNSNIATPTVGVTAKKAWAKFPESIIKGTKRSMGNIVRNFFIGDVAYSPEEAATIILQYLVKHPVLQEEKAKFGGIWAVITVPAHFDDAARQATVEAAMKAEINVLRIVNEPTAAALAYSMLENVDKNEHELLAVFDFGGGTFDVSIVEREGLIFNVLSSEGDIYLGGDDIDVALAYHLLENLSPKKNINKISEDSVLFRHLLRLAEEVKIVFQTELEYKIYEKISDDFYLDYNITRDVFDNIVLSYIQRTVDLTEKAVHAAKQKVNSLSRILLVGGSTRLIQVTKALSEYFPKCEVDARLEPDLAVSWGATLQAAIILSIEPNTILVDVCSHSLGIAVAEDSSALENNYKKISKKYGITRQLNTMQLKMFLGDKFDDFNRELTECLNCVKIIHRNSALPARRSEFFSTIYDNQAAVHVVVVQGEGETVAENKLIGSFLFNLEQPFPAMSRCEVQLTYDANGMIHVLAKQLGKNNEAEAKFDSRTGEVIGWNKLKNDIEEKIDNIQFNNHKLEKITPDALFVGGSVDNIVDDNNIEVLNGLIAHVRREIKKANKNDQLQLNNLLNEYIYELKIAQNGTNNDDKIEQIENNIYNYIKNINHEGK